MDELEIELEQIYDAYFRDVYRFVLSLSRNEQVAEEITQETFFKALQQLDRFQRASKISVWLCQIAKNTYFTYLDKQRRLEPEGGQEWADGGSSFEERLVDKADALRLHKLLHSLDEPYKEVFMLRVFGELSFDQIAQIFGRTESWARVTFHRAKHKIRELWREEEA
ncbi:RNA polymerase sigma factor [Paenibacillus phocaensis]|uniref:RNA polymerase sigma factor n=1 Tax=Paenibacillus phocaensis TaxID=1776378 RepID=UPI00039A0CA9|nr:RNA polymerase sigma factor [Paenibacillus phocaensis]